MFSRSYIYMTRKSLRLLQVFILIIIYYLYYNIYIERDINIYMEIIQVNFKTQGAVVISYT